MKLRSGFVSNSSSSSFVCRTKMSLVEVTQKLHLILDFYNELNGTSRSYAEIFCDPYKGSKKYDKELKEWGYLDSYKVDGTTVGKVIIDSTGDSTIPYELFELIETTFDGNRLHMG